MKKVRVGILCGGKSAEHEISLLSAQNVVQAIDKEKYDVVVIGIDQNGKWFLQNTTELIEQNREHNFPYLNHSGKQLGYALDSSKELVTFSASMVHIPLDVIFPVLHGPYGEDGTVQGFLKLAGVPFVGPSVLGSAIGMDKDVTKRLLRDAGIPVSRFLVFRDNEVSQITFDNLQKDLGVPFFVKPANLGSSIGVSKVHNENELKRALEHAFTYDTKALIEEAIIGKEIECAVLGNDQPKASVAGEIVPKHEFYDYNAKYIDEDGAMLKIPADIPLKKMKEIQLLACKVYQVLCLEGMARVDYFLSEKGKIVVNEVNTIPGFTNISMYPKLWEASGISYTELIDRLIQLALERYQKEQKLKTVVTV